MIGYYVHHRGTGHLARMRCIREQLGSRLTVLSSLPADGGGPWIQLPPDDGTAPAEHPDPTAGGTLHWAPRHHSGLRHRMATIAEWIGHADPDLMVVDVSVEVGMLCRLLGVPLVVAAMRGDRTDRPHRTVYDAADALIAPWPAAFPEPGWPDSWHAKTSYVGAFSRFDDRLTDRLAHRTPADPAERTVTTGDVVVLWGGGNGQAGQEMAGPIRRAAASTPGARWRSAADIAPADPAPAEPADPADQLWELLRGADVVVTHAGQNAVAEVAAARRPAVVITDPRPHGEQEATGAALAAAGLAVVVDGWPDAADWPGLLDQARTIGGDGWSRWNDGRGAARAARLLERLAPGRGVQPTGPDRAEGGGAA